jgi:hypothetical protein
VGKGTAEVTGRDQCRRTVPTVQYRAFLTLPGAAPVISRVVRQARARAGEVRGGEPGSTARSTMVTDVTRPVVPYYAALVTT